MESLSGVLAFVHVAQLGSFAAAGRKLSLSPSAVSKAVSRLEQRLGVSLLRRTTRRVALTEEGSLLVERYRQVLLELEEAEDALDQRRQKPRGPLRVDLPIALGRQEIVPRLPAFLERFPEIRLELTLNDRFVDIFAEGIDVLVRVGGVPDSRLVARPLGSQRFGCFAAPSYLARAGTPAHPAELAQHRCLNFRGPHSGRLWRWQFADNGRALELPLTGPLNSNDGDALIAAAVTGVGIIQVPHFMVRPALARGALEPILEEFQPPPVPISVVWVQQRPLAPKVRAFVDFLVELCEPKAPWD